VPLNRISSPFRCFTLVMQRNRQGLTARMSLAALCCMSDRRFVHPMITKTVFVDPHQRNACNCAAIRMLLGNTQQSQPQRQQLIRPMSVQPSTSSFLPSLSLSFGRSPPTCRPFIAWPHSLHFEYEPDNDSERSETKIDVCQDSATQKKWSSDSFRTIESQVGGRQLAPLSSVSTIISGWSDSVFQMELPEIRDRSPFRESDSCHVRMPTIIIDKSRFESCRDHLVRLSRD
jgi:hypothetical protein